MRIFKVFIIVILNPIYVYHTVSSTLWNLSKVDVNVHIDNVDVEVHLGVKVLLVVGHQVSASVFADVSALRRSPSVLRSNKTLYGRK